MATLSDKATLKYIFGSSSNLLGWYSKMVGAACLEITQSPFELLEGPTAPVE